MKKTIRAVFTVNLGVKKNERVLVFTDAIRDNETPSAEERKRRTALPEIAKEVAAIGREYCLTDFFEYPALAEHGTEPPPEMWEAAFGKKTFSELKASGLLDRLISKTAWPEDVAGAERIISERSEKTYDAVIALSNFSTSHTRFRDLLTRVKRARYASMPIFDKAMFDGAMTADWNKVKERTERLVKMFQGADTVYVTSHNGTSISFSVKGRELMPDTGILTEPGKFGNLPAGEGFLAPVEGTADGTLVLEWAPTGRLKTPVELNVKKGLVVEVIGTGALADDLREKTRANELMGNVAELGIGTNDKAKRPDNILETEKILGTVHIALGDNSSFGGKVSVPFHEDFIFFRPNLEIIKGETKTEVIVDGEVRF